MSKTPAPRRKRIQRSTRASAAGHEPSPDYVSYHSGSTGPPQEPAGEVQPAAFALEEAAFTAFVAAPTDKFYIKFRTANLRPNHLITIRNNVDGWDQDIYGAYFPANGCLVWRRTGIPMA